ncbi:ArnT family glycosyltransferase [Elusimicrobiota bacterium]
MKSIHEKIKPVVILVIFSIICIFSYLQKSPTYDEIQHLSSGYALLKTGKLDIGIGHPHLYRYLIGIPLLIINPEYSKDHYLLERKLDIDPWKWSVAPDYAFGKDLFYHKKNDPDVLFFWGRLVSVIIGMFLCWGVYIFSRNIFGEKAGVFSLFLCAFSPTIIAHSRLTVNDIAGTAGILFALYAFTRYFEKNSTKNLIILAAVSSAALLIKFNAVLLIPFIFAGMIITDRKKALYRFPLFIAGIMLVINIAYGFQGTFELKAIEYEAFSKLIPFQVFDRICHLIYKITPLPVSYINSFIRLLTHGVRGHSTFLMGDYSVTGWWYYFPLALFLKTPLITLGLFLIWLFKCCRPKQMKKEEIILILFAVFYSIVSIKNKINIGHRHILPVYPIIFILMGRVYEQYKDRIRKKAVIYGLPLVYLVSTQIYFPHYLSFFNCLIRPANGHKYLSDSNLDWGQDLPALKNFLKKNDDPSLILSFFGTASRKHYGIDYQPLLESGISVKKEGSVNPVDAEKEYLAISVTNMQAVYLSNKEIFSWLKKREPVGRAGYSIIIYDISKDVEAAAIIGNIYYAIRDYRLAERQFKRMLFITNEKNAVDWAEARLKSIEEINRNEQ